MSLSVDQILEEARHLSTEDFVQLQAGLAEMGRQPPVSAELRATVMRRIEEVRSGKVRALPIEDLLAQGKKILLHQG